MCEICYPGILLDDKFDNDVHFTKKKIFYPIHDVIAGCKIRKNLFGGHDVRRVKISAGHEVGDFCISRRPHHGWCRVGRENFEISTL